MWMKIAINAPKQGIVPQLLGTVERLAGRLPYNERAGLQAALDYLDPSTTDGVIALLAISKMLTARVQTINRHDADTRRRTIVGARVKRDFADLCKQAAEERGLSMTKWCHAALWDALVKQEKLKAEQEFEDDDAGELAREWMEYSG